MVPHSFRDASVIFATLLMTTSMWSQEILRLPPDPIPILPSGNRILYVDDAGVLPAGFAVSGGARLELFGGHFDSGQVEQGGELHVFAGRQYFTRVASGGQLVVHDSDALSHLYVSDGGAVRILGGEMGNSLFTHPGASLTVVGSGFELDGQPVAGLENIGDSIGIDFDNELSVLTGQWADGRSFLFSPLQIHMFAPGTMRLELAAEGPVSSQTWIVPEDTPPLSVSAGQSIHVADGGFLPSGFRAFRGSSVLVDGGSVGRTVNVLPGAHFELNQGTIDTGFRTFQGADVQLNGGDVGLYYRAIGSTVRIDGAVFDFHPEFADATAVTMDSGALGNFATFRASTLDLRGGEISVFARFLSGSQIVIDGGVVGDFASIEDRASVVLRSGSIGSRLTVGGQFNTANGTASGTLHVTGGTIGDALLLEGSSVGVFDGGLIGADASFSESATATIHGGTFGDSLSVREQASLIIHGGNFGDDFVVSQEGHVEIRGGTFGNGLRAWQGGQISLFGTDFRVDDVPLTGLGGLGESTVVSLSNLQQLTATLADGTPFFFGLHHDRPVSNFELRLVEAPVESPTEFDISIASESQRLGIVAGQRLTVLENGRLPANFNAGSGSTLTIRGGAVTRNLEMFQSQLILEHGAIGDDCELYSGTDATIYGGTIGQYFTVHSGARLSVQGGVIDDGWTSYSPDDIEVRGGVFGNFDYMESLALYGSDFSLNGEPMAELIDAGQDFVVDQWRVRGQTVSGVLADGTPFILDPIDTARIHQLKLVPTQTVPPLASEYVVDGSLVAPRGLRPGQTLRLLDAGELPEHFAAGVGSQLNFTGGKVGRDFDLIGAELDVSGTAVLADIEALGESRIHFGAGQLNGVLSIQDSVHLEVHGGQIEEIHIRDDASFVMQGGEVGRISASLASTPGEIHGGRVGILRVFLDSNVEMHGGSIAEYLQGGDRSEFALHDGVVAGLTWFKAGSQLSVHGGILSGELNVDSGAQVTFSGGNISGRLSTAIGANVEVVGTDFELDGVPVPGLSQIGDRVPWNLLPTSVLSVTLADGTSWSISGQDGDSVPGGTVMLVHAGVVEEGGPTVELPGSQSPRHLRPGQDMNVRAGGFVSDGFRAGRASDVVIDGGMVGEDFEATGSRIALLSGTIAARFDAFPGTEMVVRGGTLGAGATIYGGATLTIEGGDIGAGLLALPGSVLQFRGGRVGDNFHASHSAEMTVVDTIIGNLARFSNTNATIVASTVGSDALIADGARMTLRSGVIGDGLTVRTSSVIALEGGTIGDQLELVQADPMELHGNSFWIDGQPLRQWVTQLPADPLNGFELDPSQFETLTGTLKDGTPFAFSTGDGDVFRETTIALYESESPPPTPWGRVLPHDLDLHGIRAGQQLMVQAGSSVGDHFNAGRRSRIEVDGGTIGHNLELVQATLTMSAGAVGERLDAFDRSHVLVRAGEIGAEFEVHDGALLTMSGGTVGDLLRIRPGGMFDFTGGVVAGNVDVSSRDRTIVHGGSIQGRLAVGRDASVLWQSGTVHGLALGVNSRVIVLDGDVSGIGSIGDGGVLDIYGGHATFTRTSSGTINIIDGMASGGVEIRGNAVTNVRGGSVDRIDVQAGAVLNISGGEFGFDVDVGPGAMVNLFGTQFLLDGVPLEALDELGETRVLETRGEHVLTVVLRDANRLDLALRPTDSYTGYIDPDATLQLHVAPAWQSGDFNRDDAYTIADIDALTSVIVSGRHLELFDLNRDQLVDTADRNRWLEIAAESNLGPGARYPIADANLDGIVDGLDFDAWESGMFTLSARWSRGDFNADGVSDLRDFHIWHANKGGVAAPGIVPEPARLDLMWLAVILAIAVRRGSKYG